MAENHAEHTRRDVLQVATAAVGAVGVAAAVWPLVDSMSPDAIVRSMAEIDVTGLSGLEPGGQIKTLWQGKPVVIARRTEEQIAAAVADNVAVSDIDGLARNANLPADAPATDENRHAPDKPEWLIMVALCTHLGCVPTDNAGDFGGWYCPCHGSHYDTAGRIRRGPAPRNLDVPPYTFIDDDTVRIG